MASATRHMLRRRMWSEYYRRAPRYRTRCAHMGARSLEGWLALFDWMDRMEEEAANG